MSAAQPLPARSRRSQGREPRAACGLSTGSGSSTGAIGGAGSRRLLSERLGTELLVFTRRKKKGLADESARPGITSCPALEREAGHDLSRTRLWTEAGQPGIGRVDVAVAAGEHTVGIARTRVGVRREEATNGRRGEENAVKHVVEFRANVEANAAFLRQREIAPEAERFSRLALPAVIVIVRSRGPEGPGRGVAPRLGIERERGLRVEAMAIRIDIQQRHAWNAVLKSVAASENGGVVGAGQLPEEVVTG